jgi:molybdopterin-guanine dinucleotide biosynthesis protein A
MTGEPAAIAAIVLAGGRGRRFGGDKLAVRMADGRSVLAHSVAAVAAVADEVVVVVAPGASLPSDVGAGVRIVHDPEAYGGPLVGLLAGLEGVAGEVVLVVGGDMPAVRPAVLRLLGGRLGADPAIEAARLEGPPEDEAGVLERRVRRGGVPLPCVVRRAAATTACREALAAGDRRLRGCLERLATTVVAAGEWRALDPSGRSLLDIDAPADFAGLDAPG